MTLEQLRIFVAVAEHEHVTRAAAEINLTQSATSAAIAALEARYASKLFNRIGRRIELTQAGRLFLVEARAVLARAAAAENVLADIAGLKRGSLRLAASQTVGNYWLPPLMHRYRADHPGIALAVNIGNTEAVSAWVREGVADLGFVEGPVDDPALSVTPVAEDELILVVSPALARQKRHAVSAADLKAMPWVFREPGSATRALFEQAIAKAGLAMPDIEVVLELPSNEAVRAAVAAGAGAAVLSKLVVTASIKAGSLIALDFVLPKRRFFALHHKDRSITQAERELFKLIETRPQGGTRRPTGSSRTKRR
ncbi:MAG TPA: LysR family transcriptional regulator [Pseudolabrys sp.]|nr:LysR family transcriptional regulator [Pseudolabrys sp.]